MPLAARALAARVQEMYHLFIYLCMNGLLRELLFISGPVSSVVIFTYYVYVLEKRMTLVQVIRVLATVNVMRFPLNMLGQALRFMQDARISCERLSGFFLLPIREDLHAGQDGLIPLIAFNGASFAWNAADATTRAESAADAADSAEAVGGEASGGPVPQEERPEEQPGQDTETDTAKPFRLNEITLRFGSNTAVGTQGVGAAAGGSSSLVAFLGSVGSGKSSLLQAVLGEIPQCKEAGVGETVPQVSICGKLVYCSQQPWIQNMTLRDNVLFGYVFSDTDPTIEEDYQKAIAAAALLPDIEILRQGDLTEIGERGVNLSGGQKARVAIARAFFVALRRANICLLDDPFSAVDGDTGTSIFHNGLRGLLRGSKDKARITLVCLNSHLHLLPFFDRVVMLEAGAVVADGTPSELATGEQAAQLATATGISQEVMLQLVEAAAARASTPPPTSLKPQSVKVLKQEKPEDSAAHVAAAAVVVAVKSTGNEPAELAGEEGKEDYAALSEEERLVDGKIIIAEKRVMGSVKLHVYLDYFSASLWPLRALTNDTIFTGTQEDGTTGKRSLSNDSNYAYFTGLLIGIGLVSLFVVAQAARIGVDYALARWAGDTFGDPHSDWATAFYALFGALALFILARSFYINYWTWKSSRAVHEATFHNILQAPVTEFFDTHTVGEVLNKLSRDTEVMDSAVPEFLLQFCIYFMQVAFTFGICVWSSPFIAVGFIPLCYG